MGEAAAVIYFIVFVFGAGFIILNLFVMIISDNFEADESEEVSMYVGPTKAKWE